MSSFDRSAVAPRSGAVAGVAAFLAGYLVTYVWQASRIRDALGGLNALLSLIGGDPIPTWKAVGWLFYSAHYVSVTYPNPVGGRIAQNLIADGNAPGLLYLLPPILLVLAGATLARVAGRTEPLPGALTGGSVSTGYAPLAVAGVLVFRVSFGDATVAPDPVTGVLLAGVVYPQLLGGVGGALAALVSS